jgi:hypothetical protein
MIRVPEEKNAPDSQCLSFIRERESTGYSFKLTKEFDT